jgi:regulator of cell morphogenesis and NO signaling
MESQPLSFLTLAEAKSIALRFAEMKLSEWPGCPSRETNPPANGEIPSDRTKPLALRSREKKTLPATVIKVIGSAKPLFYSSLETSYDQSLMRRETMSLDTTRTVREFATEIPNAARIFEKFGIDYCCGGGQALAAACADAKVPVDQVLHSLEEASTPAGEAAGQVSDFQNARLADLIAHILLTHHGYVKREVPRLKQLLAKVVAVHCANHPELAAVQRTFANLADELLSHMMKEEMVLFPYVEKMEQAINDKKPMPRAPFGSIANPVRMMELEHESAGNALEEIRTLTAGYAPPENACFSYKTLYSALKEFEADLHQHVHLENNILFPRAITLEGGAEA